MSVTLDEAAGMLRDLMPALIEQEETLIETLCASVCSGAGSFTAFQLVHKLVTEGLLPNAMAGIALRLQERVQHVQNAPAAAQEIWPPPGFKRDADGRADAPPTPATPPPPAAAQEGGQRTSAEVLPAGAPDAVAPAAEPAGQNHMYECLFPGCGRRYASSDATRKHARKQHRGWLESLPAQGPTHYCREVPGTPNSGNSRHSRSLAPPETVGWGLQPHLRPGAGVEVAVPAAARAPVDMLNETWGPQAAAGWAQHLPPGVQHAGAIAIYPAGTAPPGFAAQALPPGMVPAAFAPGGQIVAGLPQQLPPGFVQLPQGMAPGYPPHYAYAPAPHMAPGMGGAAAPPQVDHPGAQKEMSNSTERAMGRVEEQLQVMRHISHQPGTMPGEQSPALLQNTGQLPPTFGAGGQMAPGAPGAPGAPMPPGAGGSIFVAQGPNGEYVVPFAAAPHMPGAPGGAGGAGGGGGGAAPADDVRLHMGLPTGPGAGPLGHGDGGGGGGGGGSSEQKSTAEEGGDVLEMSRSLGLLDMSTSNRDVDSLFDLNDMSLSEGTRAAVAAELSRVSEPPL